MTQTKPPSCAECPLRRRAEARPTGLIARLWRWHTTWCPGWKKYQRWLADQPQQTSSS
jgi:hypothetical protein